MKNLKVKAAVMLAGYIATVFSGIAVLQLAAHYYGAEFVVNCFIGAVMAWLLYGVYGLILLKLQWDNKIDEISNRN